MKAFGMMHDDMHTEAFCREISQLPEIAARKRTAIMCSESVFWRCYRRLMSDHLLTNRHSVQHIFPSDTVQPHQLTTEAKTTEGTVTYLDPKMLFD